MKRKWWLISVSGYGDFGYYGTEKEAEDMRAHKASWECGAGTKKPIPATHPKAKQYAAWVKEKKTRGYTIDSREMDAIEKQP